MTTLSLSGVFSNIDQYQNLLIRLDDTSILKLESATKHFHGKSPLNKYITQDGHEINTLRLKLSPWLKLKVNFERQFPHLVKKHCDLKIEIKQYDFTNKEGQVMKGWTANYISMTNSKQN